MTNPQDPFGAPGEQPPQQPPGYGAPPPAYGQVPPPTPYGAPAPQLATWGQRAGGAMIDYGIPYLVANIVQVGISRPLGQLLSVAALAWALYNCYLAGTTGQSTGKKMVGIRLVREQDGQLVGGGLAIGRYFVHILDSLPCLLGWLWPLWDAKKQTFADKVLKTLVIKA